MLTELPFRPGVIKDEERYSARGAATDSQLIRWVRGRPEALGGWSTVLSGIRGTVRAMHEWTMTDGRPYLAIATTRKLYVYDGERLLDITPERATDTLGSDPVSTTNGSPGVAIIHSNHGAVEGDTVYITNLSVVAGLQIGGVLVTGLSNPISTTEGSRIVKVTDSAHGLNTNDLIVFNSVISAVGGYVSADFDPTFRVTKIDNNQFQIEMATAATSTATGGGGSTSYLQYKGYVITSVNSSSSYVINAGANANATTTGGGASGAVTYDINSGRENTLLSGGFGTGAFGSGSFGFGPSDLIDTRPFRLREWSLDNFGNNLVACVSGGTLVDTNTVSVFIWSFTDGLGFRAMPLANAPAQVTCIAVTPERFLLACGCTNEDGDFDPLLVRHTTGEDPTVWVAASDNSAGDFPVSGGSRLVGVVRRETGPVVFTDGGMNAVRAVGAADQIYRAEQIGVDCGLIAMHAVGQRDGDLYWVSPAYQFYGFRGGRPFAIENPNREWFERRANKLQADKIFAWPDRRFEAMQYHYAANADSEPGDFLRVDIPEMRRDPEMGWSVGLMDRTAASSGYVFSAKKPLAVSASGVLYQHEDTFGADGVALERFVQWAPIDLRDGQVRAAVRRMQIDMTLEETIMVLLGFREWPRGPASTRQLQITPTTEKCDTRGSGRQVDMRIGAATTTFWRVGAIRADLAESSRR